MPAPVITSYFVTEPSTLWTQIIQTPPASPHICSSAEYQEHRNLWGLEILSSFRSELQLGKVSQRRLDSFRNRCQHSDMSYNGLNSSRCHSNTISCSSVFPEAESHIMSILITVYEQLRTPKFVCLLSTYTICSVHICSPGTEILVLKLISQSLRKKK